MTAPPSPLPRLPIALGAVGVLLIGALVVAFGLGAFSPSPVNRPTTPLSSEATAQPTNLPTSEPTLEPASPSTLPPAATPTSSLAPATPSSATEELLRHVPEAVRGTCTPATFAAPALAAVGCAADDAAISVTYTSYADQPSMAATYEASVIAAGIEDDSGRCYNRRDDGTFVATPSRWPSENGYTIDDEPVGRYLCYESGESKTPSIAWTDDRLYILGVATSATDDIDRLVTFWANDSGPVE